MPAYCIFNKSPSSYPIYATCFLFLNLALISETSAQTQAKSLAASPAIERISVVASRDLTGAGLGEAASSDVIDLDDISIKPAKVADLLAHIPGVSLNGQGGLWQAYSVRGFSRWRVQSQVAGIPIYTERRAGNALSFIDPNLLQTVEVVKGPASSFYGSGALGGVVNLAPISGVEPQFGASFDSFANETGIYFTNSSADHDYGVAYRKADNDTLPDGREAYSQYEQLSGTWHWQHQLDEQLTLRSLFIPSYGKDIGKNNADYPESRITLYPQEKHLLAKLELVSASSWALGVYGHDQDWQSDILRPQKRRNLVDYKSLDWGANGQWAWEVANWQGRIGADVNNRSGVRVEEAQYDTSGKFSWQRTNLDAKESNFAFYGDAKLTQDNWRWHSGVRFDHYQQTSKLDKRSDHRLTGFSSLFYEKGAWLISAKLGTGFRFPGLSESYYSGSTGRGAVIGNSELKPETATNLDLGLVWDAQDIRWQLSAYSIWAKHYIERLTVSEGVLSYRNTDSGKILGVESSLRWYLSDDFSVAWNYQWQQGENELEQPLADIAPAEHNILLDYQYDDWLASLHYRLRQSKEDVASGEQALASVNVLDINVKYRPDAAWELDLAIQNITDKSYLATADDLATLMPGRHIRLGMTYHY